MFAGVGEGDGVGDADADVAGLDATGAGVIPPVFWELWQPATVSAIVSATAAKADGLPAAGRGRASHR